MEGLELGLEFPLGGRDAGVCCAELVELLVCVAAFLFRLSASAVGLFQKLTALLEFILECVGASLADSKELACLVARPLFLFKGGLYVLELLLVPLDVLLGLSVGLVGVVEGDLELVDVGLELLLHAQGLSLALGFGFEGGLHAVEGTLVVLSRVLEFLLLLLDAPVDLLSDLAELELAPEDLVLLLLEGSLGFLQSGLELVLLGLEALPGLLDLVDVAATLSDLVEEVLDLVGEVLVLATNGLELLLALLVGSLESEELGAVVAALLLAGVELSSQVVDLELPFADDLVEGLLLLLGGVCDGGGAVDLQLEILDLGGQSLLGLLQGDDLLVEGFDGLFGLGETAL